MLTRRSILVTPAALSLSYALAGSVAAQGAPRTRPRSEMASLFISQDRPLIMVRSAGGIPVPMVFDTGTNGNAADLPYATALNLQKTGDLITIDGATGKPLDNGGFNTIVPDVSMGGVNVGDQVFGIYPRRETNEAGIVGPYVFGDRLVNMELSHDRLRIRDKSPFTIPTGPTFPYLDDDRPGIMVAGPGFSRLALMDSGYTGGLMLPLDMAASLPLDGEPVITGMAISVSGSRPLYGGRMKGDIRIGPLVVTNPELQFGGVKIKVGIHLLRQMMVVMDPAGKRSWASVPDRLAASRLSDYVGRYGEREIRVENDRLVFQRDGRVPRTLSPYDGDLFDFDDAAVQIQFVRGAAGVIGFDIIERTLTEVDRTG